MKRSSQRYTVFAATVVALVILASNARLHGEDDGNRQSILTGLEFAPLDFEAPAIVTKRLSGGVEYLEVSDTSLPYLDLILYFPGGEADEPLNRAGQLHAMVELLEAGGAGDRSGSAVSSELARIGARLNVEYNQESWSIQLKTLRSQFDPAFQILRDTVLNPGLAESNLAAIRNQMQSQIDGRNDDPSGVASRKLYEVMYPGTRTGYSIQSSDIQKIDVDAIKVTLSERRRARGMMIALAGDTANLNLEERLNRLIDEMQSIDDHAPTADRDPGPSPAEIQERALGGPYAGKIALVDTPAAQTVIAIGTHLPAHNHPDFFALQTGNFVLGGGSFNSRMMREIRVERGLAYYAWSGNRFLAQEGRFVAMTATRNAQTPETLALALELIGGMQEPISRQELDLARDSILNGFVFQFETPIQIVDAEVRFRRHDMPPNYLNDFPEYMQRVSIADIQSVYRKYLQSEDLFVVVAGPAALKEKLEEIRPVVVLEPEELPYADN